MTAFCAQPFKVDDIRTTGFPAAVIAGLVSVTAGCGWTGPSLSDAKATSCGSTGIVGQVGRDVRHISPPVATISVGRTTTFSACFYRDLDRPTDRAAISWSIVDPSVAGVAPATGPSVTVTGLAFGETKLRALITGVSLDVPVIVCDARGTCPPSQY